MFVLFNFNYLCLSFYLYPIRKRLYFTSTGRAIKPPEKFASIDTTYNSAKKPKTKTDDTVLIAQQQAIQKNDMYIHFRYIFCRI